MGNTELALRHFREALKLDPEHKQSKDDYKQAKKLAKLMEKIEAVLGKDVEGKGRQKQLERDEQYEEARQLLRLIDNLEENDDVQDVYANFDISEEVMEAVAG